MIYLGVVLSYGQFELATAKHRCAQANQSFGQLRNVLRVNGVLSKAQRQKVYVTCVWPSLLYGISAVGVNHAALRTIQSTAAMHLRKLLRIHEKGWSNAGILQQADLVPLQHLQRRLDTQVGSLLNDTNRQTVAPLCRYHVQYVVSILAQRKVCINICIACTRTLSRKRLGTWQSLTKRITQGTCLRVKLAVGMGQSIDQLLEEIQAEEANDPPQPPAGDTKNEKHSSDAVDLRSIIENTPVTSVVQHSSALIANASKCLLCDQRLKQASRMKAHWQSSHATIWGRVRHHVLSEAQSLSAIMHRPCEFCGSKARSSKEHAKQCPMLFQVLSLQFMCKQSDVMSKDVDSKPVAPRKTEAAPKYKAFVSPMEVALNKGSRSQTKVTWTSTTTTTATAPNQVPSNAPLPIRTIAGMKQVRNNVGTIKQFFQPRQEPFSAPSTPPAEHVPWFLRLRLRNPDTMCYANAGILALLHVAGRRTTFPEELEFLRKVGHKAAERNIELHLPRMNGMRKIAPGWDFNPEQKDAAEFLHVAFNNMSTVQVIWDTRKNTADGIRLCTQGALPIPIPMPYTRGAVLLQELINRWSRGDDEVTALTTSAETLCVQLGRYHMPGKSFGIVDLPSYVQLPIFQDDSSVQWQRYEITGAVIHLGRKMDGDKEMEPRMEAHFFDKYWPSVQAAQSDQVRQVEAEEDADANKAAEARAAKSARFGPNKGTPGKGSSYGQSKDPDWNSWGNDLQDNSEIKTLRKEVKKLKEEMFALQKMALRHEDFGNCIKSELSWVMFLRLDMKASVVPSLYNMQQRWRELKESHPDQLTAPMRIDLVKSMFKEFS
ncbi:unnamed protein product, partial [Symbiodinium necroappetens]